MPILFATRTGLFRSEGEAVRACVEGGDFLALARSTSAPEVCYAATTDGHLYRSQDRGENWQAVGRIDGFEELSSLAVDPGDPQRLFAGMEPAALFVSDDGGRLWQEEPAIRRMSHDQEWSVPWSDAPGHVRGIAIDPNAPEHLFLAIEVGGVVRTTDGGRTWENIHGGQQLHDDVHAIAVHSQQGNILYAATRHGFGRSDDYGSTWQGIHQFDGQGYARPLAMDPTHPERLYLAAATTGPGGFNRPVGSECGIYRSEDGGRTWTHLTHGIPERFKPYVDAIDVDPTHPDHVALADNEGHVYESEDGGNTWRATHTLPPVRRLLFLS